MTYLKFILLFLPVSFLFSCQPEDPVKQEYEAIKNGSSRLQQTQVLILDSLRSEISWSASADGGEFIKGILKPGIGSLLVEKERILAGYWEGNLDLKNIISKSPDLDQKAVFQVLADSNARLRRKGVNKYHFEISLANRQVVRTDFKIAVDDSTLLKTTHHFQGNLLFADSIQYTTLPVQVKFQDGIVTVKGDYKLNFNDFGIWWKPSQKIKLPFFRPPVLLQYSLVFKPMEER